MHGMNSMNVWQLREMLYETMKQMKSDCRVPKEFCIGTILFKPIYYIEWHVIIILALTQNVFLHHHVVHRLWSSHIRMSPGHLHSGSCHRSQMSGWCTPPFPWNAASSQGSSDSTYALEQWAYLGNDHTRTCNVNRFRLKGLGPLLLIGLTLILAWINNHTPGKMWDEITYPFLNFNGCTVEVYKWISNFIQHFIMDVIINPCWDLS